LEGGTDSDIEGRRKEKKCKECGEVMFQQRQSEARAKLSEDNEIETTGKARETTSLCATRRNGFVKKDA